MNNAADNNLHISDEWEVSSPEAIHYGKVTISADGYLLITGSLNLEIDELENKKTFSDVPYEILVRTMDGEDGAIGEDGKNAPEASTVNIVIHNLKNDIHIKSIGGSGGAGGKGKDGGCGGDGGDGYKGGTGGKGGDGYKGANGGRGGNAPKVKLTYTPAGEKITVTALTKDDLPCKDNLSYGGSGGKGGDGGDAGKGGLGGLSADGKRAASGEAGTSGDSGKEGKAGGNAKMVITTTH